MAKGIHTDQVSICLTRHEDFLFWMSMIGRLTDFHAFHLTSLSPGLALLLVLFITLRSISSEWDSPRVNPHPQSHRPPPSVSVPSSLYCLS